MPMVRYQIRNEYGLADPELYGAADKDDPEALLEGVAMAGLVGVLRQLGDLAEFAAEIFHNLHEEVMSTASRGHGLMLRVQQLEAEVPSVEKAIVSQISQSSFTNNDGIEWHPNLRMDQNLITRGDMPRFILDSYEECRGPPRLFTLDKFDVAGAGACLKRYSDPSFFKMDLATSGMMGTDVPREKKVRKIKKKGPRWRKGETLESLLVSNANSNSQPISSGHISEKVPRRTVKLKSRELQDSDRNSERIYREHLLEVLSSQQKVLLEDSIRKFPIKRKLNGSGESAPVVHKFASDASAYTQSDRDGSAILSPPKQEVTLVPINRLNMQKSRDVELLEGPNWQFGELQETYKNLQTFEQDKMISESEKIPEGSTDRCTYNKPEKYSLDMTLLDQKVVLGDSECTTNGADGYRSDDIRSEQDNFVDALNILESEIETDSESKAKLEPSFLKTEPCVMDPNTKEGQQESLVQFAEPDSGKISSKSLGWDNLFNNVISSLVPESSSDSADVQLDQEISMISNSPTNSAVGLGEADDKTNKEPLLDDELMELSLLSSSSSDKSCHLKEPDNLSVLSDAKEGPYNSGEKSLTYNTQDLFPQITLHESQLETTDQNAILSSYEAQSGNNQTPEDLDGSSLQTGNLPEQTHLAEHAQADTAETLDIPKDLSQVQDISIPEVLSSHVEESMMLLTIPKEEELLESAKEDADSSISDSRSPTKVALSPENNYGIVQSDDNIIGMENCVSSEDLADKLSSSSVECTNDIRKHLDEVDSEDAEVQFDKPCHSSQTQERRIPVENHTEFDEELSLPLNVRVGEVQNSVKQETEASSSGTLSPRENAAVPSGKPDNFLQKHIEVPLQSSEDLPLPLYMHMREQQNPFIDETEDCSSATRSPATPAFTPVVSSIPVQPDGLATVAEKIVSSDGDLIGIEDTETVAVREISLPHALPPEILQSNDEKDYQRPADAESTESMHMTSMREMSSPHVLPPEIEQLNDEKDYQRSADVESAKSMPMTAVRAISLPHELQPEIEQLNDEKEHQRSADVDSTESLTMTSAEESLPHDAKLQFDVPDSVDINSFMFVGDDLKPADEATENISPKNLQQMNELLCSSDLTKDTVIVNDSDCYDLSSNCSTKPSDFQEQMQKDHVVSAGALYQPNLEDSSTSNLQNAAMLDVTLCTSSSSQVEEEQEASHTAADFELPIVDSCDAYKDQFHGKGHSQTDWNPSIDDPRYPLEDEQDFSPTVMVQNDDVGENVDRFPSTDFLWEPASSPDQEDFQSQASTEFYATSYHDNEREIEDESPADDFLWEPASPPDHEAFRSHCRTELDAISYHEDQFLEVEIPAYSIKLDEKSTEQDSEPKSRAFSSDGKASELDIPPQDSSISEEQEQEAFVSSDFDPPLAPSSSTPNISAPIPMPFLSGLVATSEDAFQLFSVPQSEEPISTVSLQDLEKPPPLPPLQWRMGKLRPGSLPTNGSLFEPASGTNPFSEPSGSNKKHELGLLAQDGMVQPTKIFSSLPVLEVEHLQHVLLDPEGEKTRHMSLSEFPPIVDVESCQQANLFPERKIEHPQDTSLVVKPMENEKCIYDYDASGGMALHPSNPFTTRPALQDESKQHLPLSKGEEVQNLQDKNFHDGQLVPGLELSTSQDSKHDGREEVPGLEDKSSNLSVSSEVRGCQDSKNDSPSLDRETQHLDPFLHGVALEDDKGNNHTEAIGQHLDPFLHGVALEDDKGNNRTEAIGQHLKSSVSGWTAGPQMSYPGYATSIEDDLFAQYDVVPATEGEILNKKPYSIRNRPRNPLIDAVAAHDRSKLRKVSELIRSSDKPKSDERNSLLELRKVSELIRSSDKPKSDERNSLLEQIRNKSFNLKPAVVAKPSVKGPATNLKVAAIIEKANAIRQAFVGSDEEDADEDNWSDS